MIDNVTVEWSMSCRNLCVSLVTCVCCTRAIRRSSNKCVNINAMLSWQSCMLAVCSRRQAGVMFDVQ